MPVEHRTTGDKLTPLGFQFFQRSSGVLTAVDLTGRVVKIEVVNFAGTTIIAETTTGVTVTVAAEGKVTWALPTGTDRLAAGEYWGYFRAYGTGGSSALADVYPTSLPIANRMHLIMGGLS